MRSVKINPIKTSGSRDCRARRFVERKIFWASFILLSLIADFSLPLLWGLIATIPIALLSWWIAYRSGWF